MKLVPSPHISKICVCVCVAHTHTLLLTYETARKPQYVCDEQSTALGVTSQLQPYGSRDGAQVIGLGSKPLYSQSHLSSSDYKFFKVLPI